MNPIVITGTVLCDPNTGIPRDVSELAPRMDRLPVPPCPDERHSYPSGGRALHPL